MAPLISTSFRSVINSNALPIREESYERYAWRQARPSHDFRIEWLTLTFDEIIEVVLGRPLIQSRVEWGTGGRRKIRRSHPYFRLPLAERVFPGTCAKV